MSEKTELLHLPQSAPGCTDTQQYSSNKAGALDDAGSQTLPSTKKQLGTAEQAEYPRGTLLSSSL